MPSASQDPATIRWPTIIQLVAYSLAVVVSAALHNMDNDLDCRLRFYIEKIGGVILGVVVIGYVIAW